MAGAEAEAELLETLQAAAFSMEMESMESMERLDLDLCSCAAPMHSGVASRCLQQRRGWGCRSEEVQCPPCRSTPTTLGLRRVESLGAHGLKASEQTKISC